MRLFFLVIISLLITESSFGQHKDSIRSYQLHPKLVVEEIFKAARTGDFQNLLYLCDPAQENDGDTKTICEMNLASESFQKEFRKLFHLAYSTDVEMVKENAAKVHFVFGPKDQKTETMLLVKRESYWYLISF